MAADPKPLTRDQLAKFLPDAEAIKRFERLFAVAGDLTPTDVATLYRLTQEASINAGTADAKAQSALDVILSVVQDAAINAGSADNKAAEALDTLGRIAASLESVAQASSQVVNTFVSGDYVDVNPLAPTPVGAVGRLKWNDTDGTLDLGLKGGNVTLQLGQENVLRVKNDEATTLNDGEVVYITGASGANLLVKRALASSDVTSASTIGVVTEQIASNGQGFITTFGQVRGFDTSAFDEGDVLYLSPTVPGSITSVKPIAPQHLVLVGYCTKKSAGNGEIFVKIDNGYELDELHNVLVTNPVSAGSLLIYDATAGVWKNARLTAGSNVSISSADGAITINSSNPGGTVTSVTGVAPVVSSGGVTPAISLAANYGDTLNPYASKTAKFFLAAPNAAAGAPTFRAIVASDIPTLNQNTTGTASNVTGTVAVANGGTGLTSLTANYIPWGNGTGAYSSSNAFKFTGSILAISAPSVTPQGKVHIGDGTDNSTTVKSTEFLVTSDDPTWVGSGGSFQVNRIWLSVSWLSLKVSNGAARFIAMDVNSDGSISPGADNAYSCGTSAKRWSVVYAGTGAINTSDANTKCQVEDLDDAEKRVAVKLKGLIKKFKFKDAVEEKGDAARIHVGAIAQDVEAAFKAEGLNAGKYALFCSDIWYEKEVLVQYESEDGQEPRTELKVQQFKEPIDGSTKKVRLGLRYDQLLAFIISSI